jgi:predicted transcriptional regulator
MTPADLAVVQPQDETSAALDKLMERNVHQLPVISTGSWSGWCAAATLCAGCSSDAAGLAH